MGICRARPLSQREKAGCTLVTVCTLLYAGMAFAYFVVFPIAFAFLIAWRRRGNGKHGYFKLLEFCAEIVLCFWGVIWNSHSHYLTVLDRSDRRKITKSKTPLCCGGRIYSRYATNAARYYFANLAGYSDVVFVWSWRHCGWFICG